MKIGRVLGGVLLALSVAGAHAKDQPEKAAPISDVPLIHGGVGMSLDAVRHASTYDFIDSGVALVPRAPFRLIYTAGGRELPIGTLCRDSLVRHCQDSAVIFMLTDKQCIESVHVVFAGLRMREAISEAVRWRDFFALAGYRGDASVEYTLDCQSEAKASTCWRARSLPKPSSIEAAADLLLAAQPEFTGLDSMSIFDGLAENGLRVGIAISTFRSDAEIQSYSAAAAEWETVYRVELTVSSDKPITC